MTIKTIVSNNCLDDLNISSIDFIFNSSEELDYFFIIENYDLVNA